MVPAPYPKKKEQRRNSNYGKMYVPERNEQVRQRRNDNHDMDVEKKRKQHYDFEWNMSGNDETATAMRSIFTFTDIENSMNTFSGKKNQRVDDWIKELEQTAILFKWNELHKSIYSRRLLKGSAKAFARKIKAVS